MVYAVCKAAQQEQICAYGFTPIEKAPPGKVLWGSAVSGGSLWGHLRDGIALHGREKLVLYLEKTAMVFPLPCPCGVGKNITEYELSHWKQGKNVFFSPELGAKYFICGQGTQLRFVLFDDADTFSYKLRLAKQMELHDALFFWDEWCTVFKKTPDPK